MSCETRVKDVMVAPPIVAPLSITVLEAANLMKTYGVGSVILVDMGKPVGIFSEKELVWVVSTLGCEGLSEKAFKHCLRSFPIFHESTCIGDAVRQMKEYNVRHAPVVDEYNQIIGVVSIRDIAMHLSGIE